MESLPIKNILIVMMIVFTIPVLLMMVGKKVAFLVFKPFKGIFSKLLKLVIVMAIGIGLYLYFTGAISL